MVAIAGYYAARGRWSLESGLGAVSRLLDSGLRVGLAVHHVSSGGLESLNNGTESLAVFNRCPLGRPGPDRRDP